MFSDKNHAAVYLERNTIIYANPEQQIFEQLELDHTLIHHLEVVDAEKLTQILKDFFEHFPTAPVTLFLAKPIVFEREIKHEEITDQTPMSPVEQFLTMVPISKQNLGTKVLEGDGSILCLATNKTYYETVLRAAELAGMKPQAVVPAFLFNGLETASGIEPGAVKNALTDKTMLRSADFLDGSSYVISSEAKASHNNESDDSSAESSRSHAKTIFLTLLLIGLLAFSLIFSYMNGLFDRFLVQLQPNNTGFSSPVPQETTSVDLQTAPDVSPESSGSAVILSDLRAKITNGTGISGQAARAQDALAPLKMKETLLDQIASKGATITIVGYDPRVPMSLVTQVRDTLAEIFEDVEEKEATDTGEFDFLITTGKEKPTTR